MQKHISLGALHKRTGEYVYPKIAAKGELYICPECNTELVLCKGPIVAAYFRHKSEKERPCNHYTSPGESQIHKDAKMTLMTAIKNGVRITVRRTYRCCKTVEESEIPEFSETSSIELEYRFNYNDGLQIADVAYVDNGEPVCMFEIKHTHGTAPEKRPEPWFELDARALIDALNSPTVGTTASVTLECVRPDSCEMCSEYGQNPDELLVRKTLGQTTVNRERDPGRTDSGTQDHLKFCFDSDDDTDYNRTIISKFNGTRDKNGVFGDYRAVIHSHEGSIWAIIVKKQDYYNHNYNYWDYWSNRGLGSLKNPYIASILYWGNGTVKIIESLIKIIEYNMDCIKNYMEYCSPQKSRRIAYIKQKQHNSPDWLDKGILYNGVPYKEWSFDSCSDDCMVLQNERGNTVLIKDCGMCRRG